MYRRVYLLGTSWACKRAFAHRLCGSDVLEEYTNPSGRCGVTDTITLVPSEVWAHCPLLIPPRTGTDISDADVVIVCAFSDASQRIERCLRYFHIPETATVEVCVLETSDSRGRTVDYAEVVGRPVRVQMVPVEAKPRLVVLVQTPLCASSDLHALWEFVAYATNSNLCAPQVLSGRDVLITKGPYSLETPFAPPEFAASANELYALLDRTTHGGWLKIQTPHAEFPVWVVHAETPRPDPYLRGGREVALWLAGDHQLMVQGDGKYSVAGWKMSWEEERREDDPVWTRFTQWIHLVGW